jgi:ABC-type Fe3+/spermidine/putrescine transport system ATPase subunit
VTIALELAELVVPFGDETGLAPLSLTVATGERVAIVGASGAGKTSMLRAIAGLAPVAGGRVSVAGADVTRLPPERRGAIYLHQTPLLFPHLPLLGNVEFPLRMRGVPRAERAARAHAALGTVRLEGFADRMPHTLSGGQRHRAALARAVVARPPLLLLDEPLAALDPSLRAEVREALLGLQREYGPALLIVTHDLDEAAVLAERIGVLLGRRLVQVAPPGELFTRPASIDVARFLGGFVEVAGRMKSGHFVSALGTFEPAAGAPADGPAIAVVRADAFDLGLEGVEAKVLSVHTLASRAQVVVEVAEERMELALPLAIAPPTGATVRLSLPPGRAVVFPAYPREAA